MVNAAFKQAAIVSSAGPSFDHAPGGREEMHDAASLPGTQIKTKTSPTYSTQAWLKSVVDSSDKPESVSRADWTMMSSDECTTNAPVKTDRPPNQWSRGQDNHSLEALWLGVEDPCLQLTSSTR